MYFNPLPSLMLQSARDLNVSCRPKALLLSYTFKWPLKKMQSFCPCSRALNRSGKGLISAFVGWCINCQGMLGTSNIKFANARWAKQYELLCLCYVEVLCFCNNLFARLIMTQVRCVNTSGFCGCLLLMLITASVSMGLCCLQGIARFFEMLALLALVWLLLSPQDRTA
jgi:hypothetical protein